MKTKLMALLALPMLMLQVSCSENQEEKMENDMDTAATKVETVVENVQEDLKDYRDEEFVENVYKNNQEELLLLNLGAAKGGSSVKDAAKRMKGEHEKIDKGLKDYAAKNNITLNTDAVHDNLETAEQGAEWDKDWMRKVENSHQKIVNKFERKEQNANSADLKAMVSASLPALREHLGMVKTMNANQ